MASTPLVPVEGTWESLAAEITLGDASTWTYHVEMSVCYPDRHFVRGYYVNGATSAAIAQEAAVAQAKREYPDTEIIVGPVTRAMRARIF